MPLVLATAVIWYAYERHPQIRSQVAGVRASAEPGAEELASWALTTSERVEVEPAAERELRTEPV